MKITDLKVGDKAYIKSINCNSELLIHLLELGLVKNTTIIVKSIVDNTITINYRNSNLVINKDIGDCIDCAIRKS